METQTSGPEGVRAYVRQGRIAWRAGARTAASTRMRLGLIGLGVAALLAHLVIAFTNPRGDFLLHWEFGRRLRTGTFLYEGDLHPPYPPAWAVLHVPLSLMP